MEDGSSFNVPYVVINTLATIVACYVRDIDNRYRARKFVTFFGYLAALAVITIIFSDKLGGFTVAFGVAGWVAISAGSFYASGDRVQVGGIRGDVIDVSILRTTLMEVGEWVAGGLYTGRIVRVSNSSVFKEPVFNYSGDFPFLWDEITLPVKYGSDWKQAKEMLRGLVNEVLQGKLEPGGAQVSGGRRERRAHDYASGDRQLDRVHGPLCG